MLALAAGGLLFLLSYLGFALTDANLLLVALCFIAAGLGTGAVIATEAMLLEDIVDDHLRPATEGLLGVVRAVGNFTASAVTGILWSVVSVRAALLYLGGWMVISLVGLALASRNGGSPARRLQHEWLVDVREGVVPATGVEPVTLGLRVPRPVVRPRPPPTAECCAEQPSRRVASRKSAKVRMYCCQNCCRGHAVATQPGFANTRAYGRPLRQLCSALDLLVAD